MTSYAVVDLGYGDSGKGTVTEYLAVKNDVDLVVFYNGGAQRAHRVVSGSKKHIFSQWGSASLDGVKTFHSKYSMVNPNSMYAEWETLNRKMPGVDPFDLLRVHEDCIITTPFHIAVNRIRENLRGAGRFSSCGMGIGETMQDHLNGSSLTVGEVRDLPFDLLVAVLKADQRVKRLEHVVPKKRYNEQEQVLVVDDEAEMFAYVLQKWIKAITIVDDSFLPDYLTDGKVVFEGSQGVLIDQDYGLGAPNYATWSKCTLDNVFDLCQKHIQRTDLETWGVIRAFMTRHGRGPFQTEEPELRPLWKEAANKTGPWQGEFRVGWFDVAAVKHSLKYVGIDYLAITHLDVIENLGGFWFLHVGDQRYIRVPADEVANTIETLLDTPIGLKSYGPEYKDKELCLPSKQESSSELSPVSS